MPINFHFYIKPSFADTFPRDSISNIKHSFVTNRTWNSWQEGTQKAPGLWPALPPWISLQTHGTDGPTLPAEAQWTGTFHSAVASCWDTVRNSFKSHQSRQGSDSGWMISYEKKFPIKSFVCPRELTYSNIQFAVPCT